MCSNERDYCLQVDWLAWSAESVRSVCDTRWMMMSTWVLSIWKWIHQCICSRLIAVNDGTITDTSYYDCLMQYFQNRLRVFYRLSNLPVLYVCTSEFLFTCFAFRTAFVCLPSLSYCTFDIVLIMGISEFWKDEWCIFMKWVLFFFADINYRLFLVGQMSLVGSSKLMNNIL